MLGLGGEPWSRVCRYLGCLYVHTIHVCTAIEYVHEERLAVLLLMVVCFSRGTFALFFYSRPVLFFFLVCVCVSVCVCLCACVYVFCAVRSNRA